MLYLLLAIICSSSIALIFKYADNSGADRYVVTSANYLTAFLISLFMILSRGLLSGIEKEQAFADEFSNLLARQAGVLSPYSSVIWGLIVGSIAGVFFCLSFIYYQESVQKNGVSITGTVAKLGIVIPVLFSIFIWKEMPTTIQWLGIVLALVSILILNLSPRSLEKLDIRVSLILLFLFGGLAEFSNKVYQQYGLNEYKDFFLFAVFLVAFLLSAFYVRKKEAKIKGKDVLIGCAVGIPNLFSSYFLILSLDTVAASIAYPIFSAGAIVLINLGGYLIFKERISRKNKLAIALTIVALVLLSL
ncbi:MAG: SMR family transporter [Eubacteriales bacterium]|nr:SMR family transporter [Eubacteriales bacterium]